MNFRQHHTLSASCSFAGTLTYRAACRWCLAAACLLGGIGQPLHAEVWAYRDETGKTHFAPEKKDERYQLFFKGGSSLDPPDPISLRPDPKIDEFKATTLFQKINGHPNAGRYDALIERHATERGLEPALVKAVIAAESSFEPTAVSSKGALGLMQILPETGERYGITGDKRRTLEQKLFDPEINIGVGTRYLSDLRAMFANDLKLVLAAYNAGEGNVLRFNNSVPPFPETIEYVNLVQSFHAVYTPPPKPPPKPSRLLMKGLNYSRQLPDPMPQPTPAIRSP